MEIRLKGPEALEGSQRWSAGDGREGRVAVMKEEGTVCKTTDKSFGFTTNLGAIFPFFLETRIDKSLTQVFNF